MSSLVLVRAATAADSASALRVRRESVTRSCVAEHQNDGALIERWLGNNTVEHFERWLASPDMSVVVAELAGEIRGLGGLSHEGKINLCYVEPEFQGRGLGRALLLELEARAAALGLSELSLESTLGACRFYEQHGYTSTGEPHCASRIALRCYPYRKVLAP